MSVGDASAAAMSVSELAHRATVRADTIRYYERVGLLVPARRTAAGHRRYGEEAVDRLLFIRGAQRLGLRLREIRELVSVRETGVCPCEPAEVLLRQKITEIEDEIARLSALHRDLISMADQLPWGECPDPAPGTWCPPARNFTRKEV
jgi:DNA-binding transcriptional MerR regulator